MSHSTSPPRRGTVLAVTSGKGGVGKTSLAINISVALARLGSRVAIVDGDFGLGSIDVMLGLTPQAHVGHLLTGSRLLPEILVEGPRGIQLLPAGSGIPPLTLMAPAERDRFAAAIAELRAAYDFVIIDTAPGIGDNVVATLQLAQHVLLVTSLDPAALVDAYALVKVLWRVSPQADVGLIANRVRDGAEGQLAFRQIDRAATRFLGQHMRYFGYIPTDPAMQDAMLQQAALVDEQPQTPASRSFRLLANRLATLNTGPGAVRLLPVPAAAPTASEVSQCA